ncbi:MAG: hypothetical protein WDN04_15530 [Rhodospirillales bacterium]
MAPLVVYDTATVDGPDVEAYEDPPPDASAGPAADAPPDGAAPGPAAAAGTIPPLPAPPPGWYRCPDPNGYYPSVGACTSGWMLVQEAPPAGAN